MDYDFKIRATKKNIDTTMYYAPAGVPMYYPIPVGNAIAEITAKWIYFTLDGAGKAMLGSGQISKRGFLRANGYYL